MAPRKNADSTSTDEELSTIEERDEVQIIEKGSAQDTFRVKMWRLATTTVLLLTAFAVTYTTYTLLKKEEKKNFEIAFDQFSRSVGDAAVDQQKDLRDGISYIAAILSVHAKNNNMTWPFVLLPGFEIYGSNMLKQSHAEVASLFPMVTKERYQEWVDFSTDNYQDWVKEGHVSQKGSLERLIDPSNETYHPYISMPTAEGFVKDVNRDVYWPSWYYSPPPATYGFVNWNMASIPDYGNIARALQTLRQEVLVTQVREHISIPTAMTFEEHDKLHSKLADSSAQYPHSVAFSAVHLNSGDYNSEIVAMLGTVFSWDEALLDLLPEGVATIHTIIRNNCNQSYTYEIEGGDALFVGPGDLHESEYDDMEVEVNLALHTNKHFAETPGHCQYSMHIYPTSSFEASYDSNNPEIYATIVACTFVLMAFVFFAYDIFVQRRNTNLVVKAAQTNAIVSAMFPEHLRARLIGNTDVTKNSKNRNLNTFLNDGNEKHEGNDDSPSKPLADLYLETTVMHADICGFTAWSSIREPFQVFTFLETVYQGFDRIAKKRKIFKVETIGDCYVAVAGLPEPRKDHAVAMARFARDIMIRMHIVTRELEVSLGPGTGDLSLRIGIHSGQVTGGVLRGDRSRFQLFGDTMNISSYLESTGTRGKIQASKETAALLEKCGKGHWLEKRADAVTGKGQGRGSCAVLATFWLRVHGESTGSTHSGSEPSDKSAREIHACVTRQKAHVSDLDARTNRLIDWNVEMLLQLLKQILAHRAASQKSITKGTVKLSLELKKTPFEEVQEIIALPDFDKHAAAKLKEQDPAAVEIPRNVVEELYHFVSLVAGMYRNNPFHNFDHASHVVMSITKLMSRIVAPSEMDWNSNRHEDYGSNGIGNNGNHQQTLHDHTYGINSDPLTQFACAFSGLIHDVDHSGVPNAQLIEEKVDICSRYNNRSVAEQNSLDLAWDALMKPDFDNLRRILFPTQAELVRFRQLVVNSIMATDIADKDLKALRNDRWDKAFEIEHDNDSSHKEKNRDAVNRKATIVIEHLIQASDVSHTMQHWHVYRQWNQNLFEELYVAFLQGRAKADPKDFWYKGELGFFDFYIIPLTQKLKDCGVFGVSSDEYLNYARNNREEWEERGEKLVVQMAAEARKKYGEKTVYVDQTRKAFENDQSHEEKVFHSMPHRVDFSGMVN